MTEDYSDTWSPRRDDRRGSPKYNDSRGNDQGYYHARGPEPPPRNDQGSFPAPYGAPPRDDYYGRVRKRIY